MEEPVVEMNMNTGLAALFIWNVFVFLLYGLDKWKAVCHRYRISERTLLFAAFLMGAAGGTAGMVVFRHKIRKWKFRLLLPVFLILQLVLLYQLQI